MEINSKNILFDIDNFRIFNENCFDIFDYITSSSIDLVLVDPPYGITHANWDCLIPLKPMWKQLIRIIKPNKAMCIMSNQPFTSMLVMSNTKMFKYQWYWDKVTRPTGHLNAKKRPLKRIEDICVFCNGTPVYYPQMVDGEYYYTTSATTQENRSKLYGKQRRVTTESNQRYPIDIINCPRDYQKKDGSNHPTRKPVNLMEYLIKTYTKENEIVLDFAMGSGTTGVACMNLNRKFIGCEINENYFKLAENRIKNKIT